MIKPEENESAGNEIDDDNSPGSKKSDSDDCSDIESE